MQSVSSKKVTAEATRALRSGWETSRLLKWRFQCFCGVIILVACLLSQLMVLIRTPFVSKEDETSVLFPAESPISQETSLRTTKSSLLLKGESPFGNLTTELFTVWPDEKMPSTRCFPAFSLKHPLIYHKEHLAHSFSENSIYPYRSGNETPSVCNGPQFTEIYGSPDSDRVMFSMQQCPAAKWSSILYNVLNDSDAMDWPKNAAKVEVPRSDSPGVDWVFTSCKGDEANATRHTNLQIKPYRVESLRTTSGRSVALIIMDSTSHALFRRDFKETEKVLEEFAEFSYVFEHTSVFGMNSRPNVNAMMGDPNLFEIARSQKFITSAFEEYCPDHALCQLYPYKEHRLCKNIMCNYNKALRDLYNVNFNAKPGCKHGEFFLNQHLRYITDLWAVYRKERKFHVSKPYGCHNERENRYMCNGNDAPLAAFLKSFVPSHPDTVVIIASDHGFHWLPGKGTFNDHIAGEYEHRNPFMAMIIPWAKNDTVIRANTQRFVTHRDLHATILGLLTGATSTPDQDALPGIDLIRNSVPEQRSCRDAQVPDAWCNCFRPRQNTTGAALSARDGTSVK